MQTAQEMTCTLQKQGEVIYLTPYTQEEHHLKQFPIPSSEKLDLSQGLPGGGR